MIVTTSWDDGHVLDLRVAELLRTYGLAGTFYVAPQNRELAAPKRMTGVMLNEIAQDFEIGSHTWTHPVLTEIPAAEANAELVDSRHQISDLVQQDVTSFCYPRGAATAQLAQLVQAAGYKYARTTQTLAWGPILDNAWLAPTTLEAARPGLHHWRAWSMGAIACRPNLWAGHAWPTKAIALFEKARAADGIFHIWGHSWVTDARSQWGPLETVFQHVAATPGVTHMTNGQLAEYST
jgi:peptidoglycan/xylan/chitin deacetylase (PgdA/CDA1 family)